MSGMAFRSRKSRERATLNVTSLIDVLFLLLIFFMLTGTFKRVGEMELRLPDSSTAVPEAPGETRTVELIATEEGRVYLEGMNVPLPELKARLQKIRGEDPSSHVTIKAEAAVEHGQVVRLLDIVREAGFAGVGIGTQVRAVGETGP